MKKHSLSDVPRLGRTVIPDFNMERKLIRWDVKLHRHSFYELELTTSGSGEHSLNGVGYSLSRGEIHLVRPTDIHEFRVGSELGLYMIQFGENHISGDILSKLLTLPGNLVFRLGEDETLAAEHICDALERLKGSPLDTLPELNDRLVNSLLLLILGQSETSRELIKTADLDSRMRQAILWLQLHYRDGSELRDIAGHVHLNYDYFVNCFKRELGITPREYLSHMRLEYARRLLLTTDLLVVDICLDCGYRSIATFMRDFKRKFGMTPQTMRKGRGRISQNEEICSDVE